MIKLVFCDDKRETIQRYRDLIEQRWKNHIEITEYKVSQDLWEAYRRGSNPDIVLLDIHMPTEDGIETAKHLRRLGYRGEIIFLTKDEHRAIDAFDVDAFHYVVKDGDSSRFLDILSKAIEKVNKRKSGLVSFSRAGEYRNIPISEIRYLEVYNKIITVYYGNGEAFEFYSTLAKIENLLDGRGFVRPHRSYLVNYKYIHKIIGNIIVLNNNKEIPIGRGRSRSLIEEIEKLKLGEL